MALSGLPAPSFFSQIATAILFKKKDRPTPKIPLKFIMTKIKTASELFGPGGAVRVLWHKEKEPTLIFISSFLGFIYVCYMDIVS